MTPQDHLGIIATVVAQFWKEILIHSRQHHTIKENEHVMFVGKLRYGSFAINRNEEAWLIRAPETLRP